MSYFRLESLPDLKLSCNIALKICWVTSACTVFLIILPAKIFRWISLISNCRCGKSKCWILVWKYHMYRDCVNGPTSVTSKDSDQAVQRQEIVCGCFFWKMNHLLILKQVSNGRWGDMWIVWADPHPQLDGISLNGSTVNYNVPGNDKWSVLTANTDCHWLHTEKERTASSTSWDESGCPPFFGHIKTIVIAFFINLQWK